MSAVVDAFAFHNIELLCVAVAREHLHLLARFPLPTKELSDPARHYVGIAKKQSAKALVATNLAKPGDVWAKRGKIVRITDRKHQINVFHYILRHEKEGAAVWSFRDVPPGVAPNPEQPHG